MCIGSEHEQRPEREYRTTDDVRRLFERYRAEARDYAAMTGEHEPLIVPAAPVHDERLVTSR